MAKLSLPANCFATDLLGIDKGKPVIHGDILKIWDKSLDEEKTNNTMSENNTIIAPS